MMIRPFGDGLFFFSQARVEADEEKKAPLRNPVEPLASGDSRRRRVSLVKFSGRGKPWRDDAPETKLKLAR